MHPPEPARLVLGRQPHVRSTRPPDKDGFLGVNAARCRSPPYRHRDSRNGNRPAAYANRKPSVSGPYRLAISAGSALVPPSAARSDAAAGSTRWRQVLYPAKPCGSPKGRHHTMNRTWAAPRSRASSGLQEWISPTPFRFRGYVLGGRDLRSLAASRRSTAHHGECRVARGLRAQNGPNYRF